MVKFTPTVIAASLFTCSVLAAPIFDRADNIAVVARSTEPIYAREVVEFTSRSPHKKIFNKPSQGYSEWVDALRTREPFGHGGGPTHFGGHGGWRGHSYGQQGGDVERRSFDDQMLEYAIRSLQHNGQYPHNEWVDTLRTREPFGHGGGHPHPGGHDGWRGHSYGQQDGGVERRSFDNYLVDLSARRGGGGGGGGHWHH